MATPLHSPPQPAQSNYLKWVLLGCGTAFVVGLGVVLLACAIYYFSAPSDRGSSPGPRRSLFGGSDVRLVEAHGIQTVPKTWSSCTAFAPADWTIIGNEQRVAIGVDLAAADQSMAASYGVGAVAGAAYYGMGTPEEYLQKMMEGSGNTGFELENGSRQVNGYTLRYWRAAPAGKQVRGFALYQTFDAGDPNTYIIALRMGSTEASKWEQNKNLVYDVAASIRCTKHLFPAQESSAREPKGSSKDQIEDELSTKRQEAMMGFQNVYSPTTGQHWEASYSDYNPTGPDGPGYYRRAGNSCEKLNEGFPPN